MTASPPEPRHRAVQLIEAGLTEAGCDTSAHLARWLIARLEASGLLINDAPHPTTNPDADWQQPTHPGQPTADYHAARNALRERTSQ